MNNNTEVDHLETLNEKAQEIKSTQKKLLKSIRDGFVDRVIVFIGLVGSTAFKSSYKNNPEVWILRNKQFSDLITEIILKCNGCVIKYIGDKVMATFENTSDAQIIICKIKEIEDNLKEATGFKTRIKTAVDYGPVYELRFSGHDFPDPHSSVVDRCACISKYTKAGEVVSSASFVKETSSLQWKKIGKTNLKDLGLETVYQLGRVNISIAEFIEIGKNKYDQIREELEDSKISNAQLKDRNRELVEELIKSGKSLQNSNLLEDDEIEENEWDSISELFRDFNLANHFN